MMIQTMCHQVVSSMRCDFRYGLAPLVLFLLVSSGGRNALGQAEKKPGEAKPINLNPVPFGDKDTKLSHETPDGKLAIVFMDLGSDIGLVLRAGYNTLLLVDVDKDKKPTAGADRVCGVDFGDNKLCCWYFGSDPSQCESRSGLRGSAAKRNDKWEVSMRIPKSELGESITPQAWVTFATYDVTGNDPTRIYPPAKDRQDIQRSKLFEQEFHLVYDPSAQRTEMKHRCWPPAPPRLSVTTNPVYERGQVCLAWDVPNVQSVTITGLGQQGAIGHGCTAAGPEGTMTFRLSVTSTDCPVETSVTVQVRSHKILEHMELGDFYFSHGQYQRAVAEYQKGLNLDPTNADLRAKLQRAQSMTENPPLPQ